MAALDKSAVTPYPTGDIALSEWPSSGKDNRAVYKRRVKLALTGQGTAANPIPAAAFGFAKLLGCSSLYDQPGAKVWAAMVDPVTNTILLSSATGAPADVTSAAGYMTVEGVVSP